MAPRFVSVDTSHETHMVSIELAIVFNKDGYYLETFVDLFRCICNVEMSSKHLGPTITTYELMITRMVRIVCGEYLRVPLRSCSYSKNGLNFS